MAKLPSENTNALRYFRAYLQYWIDKAGINKTTASKRLGIGQSQLNEILSAKRGASLHQIEKVCANIGIDIISALVLGKKLSGEITADVGLTVYQIEAIEAFKEVLLHGGDLAEELAERAIAIANKKRAEKPTEPRVTQKSA